MFKIGNIVLFICFFLTNIDHSMGREIGQVKKVNLPQNITDDLDFEFLLQAISRQLHYFDKVSLDSKIKFAGRTVTRAHLVNSLVEFRILVVKALNCFQLMGAPVCYKEFNKSLNDKFHAYKPVPKKTERGFKQDKTFFTAYYSPDFTGSQVKTDKYKYPIYGQPLDLELRKMKSDQINYQGALEHRGLELFYVAESLFDIWLLHVEGGGRVRVVDEDGVSQRSYYLSYAGTNKRSFKMLSQYMVKKGMLRKEEVSIENQRQYFNNHPEKQREILAYCESYVFFKVTEQEPLGVKNIPLTVGRSLATDYRTYKEYGLINLVKSKKPIKENGKISYKKFSRFFLNQDTGGSIRGNARSDLYFGFGNDAELAANYIHDNGDQYFLILK